MTILAAGYGLRNLANQGMRSVAELEAQENAIADQLEAAEQAQKTQMYSTGAGIGGSFGVNSALEAGKTAKDAIGTANEAVKGLGTIGKQGGQLTFTPTGGELLTGTEAVQAMDSAAGIADAGAAAKQAADLAQAAEVAQAAETAGTVAETVEVVEAAGTATEAVGAASTAAGSTGTAATLGTIAAPVAIGLGVAFLLNKLFD